MKRYAIRTRRPSASGYDDFASWSSDEIRHGGMTVHEPKDEPQETGLLDHLGNDESSLGRPLLVGARNAVS